MVLIVAAGASAAPAAGQQQTGQPPARTATPRDSAAIAQEIERRLGPGVTQQEIVERLRRSGLSRSQVRARLQQMGYDPGLADRYFDAIERGVEPPAGKTDEQFIEALRRIGVVDSFPRPGVPFDSLPPDSLPRDTVAAGAIQVFGRSLFLRPSSEFEPILTGPAPPNYRIGPGDEISLVLTGDVELAYLLPVNREGYLVIPDVGQVFVNGLTLAQLEDRLYDRLGRVYSGVRRGADATTRFLVSLGRTRLNQVYVIGDVARPSAYAVDALATVFHALYLAGGPNDNGSFRRIEVRRGGEVVQTVDLYDYLVRGDDRSDVRLEHGDILFVPTVERRVTVLGAVRRPAIYEVTAGEDLRDLIRYAGGFQPEADIRRIQIDRILPPPDRSPGVDRELVDVDLAALADEAGERIELHDGDVVHVFGVSPERRNRVMVTGNVRRPGLYEWRPGLTLGEVIARAQGLTEDAYTARVHIHRLVESDSTRRMIQAPLEVDSAGGVHADVILADRDSVVVFSRTRLRTPRYVSIAGFVKNPGTYTLSERMTVQDLILAAGGFVEGAEVREVELARMPEPWERTDRTAIVYRVPLAPSEADGDGTLLRAAAPDSADPWLPEWRPRAGEVVLEHGDRVFVRRALGYERPRVVTVTGEVLRPGRFVLQSRQERLSDVLQRAGGLTSEAYPPGFQLHRGGALVATDLPEALRKPESPYNLLLQDGDSLHVPVYDPTVLVTGAVTFESRVLFEPGKGLGHYLDRAGGVTDAADEDRITVTYMDGERRAMSKVLGLFTRAPRIEPGSTIYVPAKPPDERGGINWDAVLTRTTAILGTLATVIIAVDRVRE
jgi:protein involved in polysaccharide export with SLBB domain